ncbi:MAG: hypothetical protein HND58_00085 [Planctomycetota bacterium]|nr:MAG: hypothetical protein HND58_00085 [Planctomycetota bacterium]
MPGLSLIRSTKPSSITSPTGSLVDADSSLANIRLYCGLEYETGPSMPDAIACMALYPFFVLRRPTTIPAMSAWAGFDADVDSRSFSNHPVGLRYWTTRRD